MSDSESEETPIVSTSPQYEVEEAGTTQEAPERLKFDRKAARDNNIYYRGGIADDVCCVWMLVWTVLLVGYFIYVHPYNVWTQSQPFHATNGLTFSSVPFYTGIMNSIRSEIYRSWDYWIWMTDYLSILFPPYIIGVFFLVFRHQFTSVGLVLGVYIIVPVALILQATKAIYWSWLTNAYWCQRIEFCTTHDLGLPPTTMTTQFLIAVIFAWLQVIFLATLIAVPSVVNNSWRRAWLQFNGVQSKMPTSRRDADVAYSIGNAQRAFKRRSAPKATSVKPEQGRPAPLPVAVEFFTRHALDTGASK